ncbi:MAG TPA: WD40 repeat domain-containing protein [Ktedonobacterales bacterium]|nr:WD40 repeat domain-containing protein [Ktedonobacterales bacterium]
MKSELCAQCGQPLPRKQRVSRWALIALAFLAGLALAAGVQPLWLLAHRAQPSAPAAQGTPHPSLNTTPAPPAIPQGTLLLDYRGHTDHVTSVAWSPDGQRIASASKDGTVQVWDTATGGHVLTYPGDGSWVWTVAWSPDGKLIASGNFSGAVEVWDAATGAQVYTYHGHTSWVYALAWSPDGKRIASGDKDGTVQVWDATTGANVVTYRGHTDIIESVAWSPDGRALPRPATTILCRSGTPRAAKHCSPIAAIPMMSITSPGRPMGRRSPRAAMIPPCRCGTPSPARPC